MAEWGSGSAANGVKHTLGHSSSPAVLLEDLVQVANLLLLLDLLLQLVQVKLLHDAVDELLLLRQVGFEHLLPADLQASEMSPCIPGLLEQDSPLLPVLEAIL